MNIESLLVHCSLLQSMMGFLVPLTSFILLPPDPLTSLFHYPFTTLFPLALINFRGFVNDWPARTN
jgi:hypothetical protein